MNASENQVSVLQVSPIIRYIKNIDIIQMVELEEGFERKRSS